MRALDDVMRLPSSLLISALLVTTGAGCSCNGHGEPAEDAACAESCDGGSERDGSLEPAYDAGDEPAGMMDASEEALDAAVVRDGSYILDAETHIDAEVDGGVDASLEPEDASSDAMDDASSDEMVPHNPTDGPSCEGLTVACGRVVKESCCTSRLVPGGEYYRNSDVWNGNIGTYPGRVSDFALDKYEVTVGRFRRFVAAWNGGWRPEPGSGKHAHLHDGKGLVSTEGGYEAGWDPAWSSGIATTSEGWNENLACNEEHATWTSEAGARERHPINCLTWYEQYAFCIWDEGFLPSITEWNYASAGGDEQRVLPWSIPPASLSQDGTYAVYCGGNDCGPRAVGSKAPKGNGRYDHADLSGNVSEATLDFDNRSSGSCDDCLQSYPDVEWHYAGGSTFYALNRTNELASWIANDVMPAARFEHVGMRCARPPSAGSTPASEPTSAVEENFSSCVALPATCGPDANEDCCASLLVDGGSFQRGGDADFPATVSDFRLDRFEVTVGRFRKFVAAWNAGFRPALGAGKHVHLNGGLGLLHADGSHEMGWDERWNANIARTPQDWNVVLSCNSTYFDEWTPAPGANETRPMQCLTFYEAYAFCIWDGAFLPSDTEWAFAGSGGSQQRLYPWGGQEPTDAHAVFGPNGLMSLPVGSLSPLGDGYFGQADLAGNGIEWVLDFFHDEPQSMTCIDCVDGSTAWFRVARGGGLGSPSEMLLNATRSLGEQATRGASARCARPPE